MREASSGSAVATADPIRKPALSQLHSEPSNDAARRIEPTRATLRAKILEVIRAAGPASDDCTVCRVEAAHHVMGGLSDEEIAETLSMNPSTARPRRRELLEAKLIEDSGLSRPTRSGRKATIWMAR